MAYRLCCARPPAFAWDLCCHSYLLFETSCINNINFDMCMCKLLSVPVWLALFVCCFWLCAQFLIRDYHANLGEAVCGCIQADCCCNRAHWSRCKNHSYYLRLTQQSLHTAINKNMEFACVILVICIHFLVSLRMGAISPLPCWAPVLRDRAMALACTEVTGAPYQYYDTGTY